MKNNLTALALLLLGVTTRLLPHEPNFTAMGAITLFSGVYLERKHAFLVPFATLLISDFFLGTYSTIGWVYGSFLLIALLSTSLKRLFQDKNFLALPFSSALLFFVLTNFGVWVSGDMYAHTWEGLRECFVRALPFFRGTLTGDVFFATVLWTTRFVSSNQMNRLIDRLGAGKKFWIKNVFARLNTV